MDIISVSNKLFINTEFESMIELKKDFKKYLRSKLYELNIKEVYINYIVIAFLNESASARVEAVSYTHLDVYKRQILESLMYCASLEICSQRSLIKSNFSICLS